MVAALVAQAGTPVQTPRPESADERIVTANGYAFAGVQEDDEGYWFELNDDERRFRLPRLGAAALEPYLDVLAAASERGFAVRVRFDVAGSADAETGVATYRLCSLTVGNVAPIGDETVNCPAVSASNAQEAEALVARALAITLSQPQAARRLFGEALADRNLAPQLRRLALKWRGEAGEALAEAEPWASQSHDQLLVEALADYRAWARLAPDDPDPQHAIAFVLAKLGAYADAMAVYAAVGGRWPEEAFNVAIRTGTIHRQQGDYREALAVLDRYAAREGAPDGMRFAYHRGWTLIMLGRHDEAIVELNRGMESQPDYSSAYLLRSCAHAQVGSFADALRDQERGLELLANSARDGELGLEPDIARSRGLIETLRRAVAEGRREPLPAACQGHWDKYITTRPRSPLLERNPA
jgi:tetratricopeptide (TPR) repeat protein